MGLSNADADDVVGNNIDGDNNVGVNGNIDDDNDGGGDDEDDSLPFWLWYLFWPLSCPFLNLDVVEMKILMKYMNLLNWKLVF